MSLKEFSQNKSHLIFDFDETIAWIHVDWGRYYSATRSYFEKKDSELFNNARYHDLIEVESVFIEKYGNAAREELKAITTPIELSYSSYDPNHEVIQFIKDNADSFTFFIWSSNHEDTILEVLSKIGLRNYFELVVSKDDVPRVKPDPSGFEIIESHVNDDSAQFGFVGNSLHSDGAAAEAAGVPFWHVRYF